MTTGAKLARTRGLPLDDRDAAVAGDEKAARRRVRIEEWCEHEPGLFESCERRRRCVLNGALSANLTVVQKLERKRSVTISIPVWAARPTLHDSPRLHADCLTANTGWHRASSRCDSLSLNLIEEFLRALKGALPAGRNWRKPVFGDEVPHELLDGDAACSYW